MTQENITDTKTYTGSEILMRALIDNGVDTIFGYPGGAIMPVYDTLYDYRDRLNHILVRHEQAAAHAAEGYARASGKVGVCLVTSGPGVTNTVTGVADAMMDSTPIVVIAGQVGAAVLGTDAFQECDVVNMMQPVSKWAYQIRRTEDIALAVSRAFYIASSGRPGPVVLDFAKNAQTASAPYIPQQISFIRSYVPVPPTEEGTIEEAAALINGARKPLVLVGHGVEIAGAEEELKAFIEKADAPAGCTLLGLSVLPTDHPLNQGMLGMHGSLALNKLTQQCDVLIAVGMRFDDRITGNLSTYARQAKVVHFEIDRSEVNKNVQTDVAVLGDCRETLAKVTALLHQQDHSEWRKAFEPYHEEENRVVRAPQEHPAEGPLRMGEVVNRVGEITRGEAICVTDVGQNQMMGARYSRFARPRSIITSGGMGTMGFGLPAAIGATFGAPDRTVCLFLGDGGLQMTIEEFGTIMEHRCPVKIVLLNNNYLGNVRQWQEIFFRRRYSFTPMLNPDYEKIAEAYRIPVRTVTEREDLDSAIREMLATPGAFLLQCAIKEEDNVMPMVFPGHDVDDVVLTTDN